MFFRIGELPLLFSWARRYFQNLNLEVLLTSVLAAHVDSESTLAQVVQPFKNFQQ